ncbi:MAG TPA: acyl-CoA thioesterase [bacterium]|nr:acyl-CoA thioesterase [bacterium]
MNLWIRMLRVFWKSFFCKKKIGLFDESRLSFRVWPHDCDINMHLNNGRYLTLMDLGRTYLMAEMQMLWKLPKRKWFPVLGGVEILFLKSIDPFQKFDIVTHVLTWDAKWIYVEQRFERNGVVLAKAHLRALFLGPQGRVATDDIIALAELGSVEAPLHPVLQKWKD